MTSEIAAIVAFIFAVYEHGHDKTIAGWSFLIISILLFLLGTYVAWRKEYEVAEKLRELESTKPRIRLRGPQEAYIEPISQNWQGTITKAQFLKLKFINDPECPHHNAVATDVRAHVEYYRSSDNKLVQSIEGGHAVMNLLHQARFNRRHTYCQQSLELAKSMSWILPITTKQPNATTFGTMRITNMKIS